MRVRYSFGSRHTGNIDNISKQRKKFPDIVQEIIRTSDIILQVLDARFPKETRNLALEKQIKSLGKHLIFVLNKSDLLNLESRKKVIEELENENFVFVSCKERQGSGILRERIKMESKRLILPHDKMKRIQVGIVGYPNTGKSSLINILTGKSSAGVGASAGFTKGIQKIRLSRDILILDTPGVIPAIEYSDSQPLALAKHAKVNARDYSRVKNPDLVISQLVDEYSEILEKHYGIKFDKNPDTLIQEIGKKRNMIKKGAEIDEDRAARSILKDWQQGKIKF